MLLAVAGLDRDAIVERTRLLAGGDWSKLSAAERAGLAFARKQARSPASVSAEDVQTLVRNFGPTRALDVVWWTCRCHYMTAVADAFQLPLERDNVFAVGAKKKP
jgi:hypothetical protein